MNKERRLEYFEDKLWDSPKGRELVQLFETHGQEMRFLITKRRPVMVTWQRKKGPAFIRSFMDSAFEEQVPINKEIEDITLSHLLLSMAEVLQDHASPPLKLALGEIAPLVLQLTQTCSHTNEILDQINQLPQTSRTDGTY